MWDSFLPCVLHTNPGRGFETSVGVQHPWRAMGGAHMHSSIKTIYIFKCDANTFSPKTTVINMAFGSRNVSQWFYSSVKQWRLKGEQLQLTCSFSVPPEGQHGYDESFIRFLTSKTDVQVCCQGFEGNSIFLPLVEMFQILTKDRALAQSCSSAHLLHWCNSDYWLHTGIDFHSFPWLCLADDENSE